MTWPPSLHRAPSLGNWPHKGAEKRLPRHTPTHLPSVTSLSLSGLYLETLERASFPPHHAPVYLGRSRNYPWAELLSPGRRSFEKTPLPARSNPEEDEVSPVLLQSSASALKNWQRKNLQDTPPRRSPFTKCRQCHEQANQHVKHS